MTGAEPVALQQLTGDEGLLEVAVVAGEPTSRRVEFELTVRNLTSTAAVVTNPYEGLSYQLIAGSGTPIQVKAPPNQAKVHVPLDPAAKLAYLDLARADLEGNDIGIDDAIRATTFELTPGGALTMALAVTSSIDPSDRSTLDHVAPGDLQLVVMLRAIVQLGDDRHPMQFRTAPGLDVTVT